MPYDRWAGVPAPVARRESGYDLALAVAPHASDEGQWHDGIRVHVPQLTAADIEAAIAADPDATVDHLAEALAIALDQTAPAVKPLIDALLITNPEVIETANQIYLASEGVQDGDPWRPVTGYHDAYPLGFTVHHDGKLWVSLRAGASGEPGNAPGDWQEYQEPGQAVDWVQPQAGSEYPVGALVRHDGRIWENTHTGPNGWMPGAPGSQWTDVGPA